MLGIKSVCKGMAICSILMLSFVCFSYAEEKTETTEEVSFEPADSFEQALANNEALRTRYENADFDQQKKIQEHWQASKAKWDNMSDEEKAAFNAKIQECKAKWASMSDEEKAAVKEKRQQRKAKWASISDEEKAAAKAKRGMTK